MNLRKLALAACEDDDALVVFGDAVLETGWVDRRVGQLLRWPEWQSKRECRRNQMQIAATAGREWARACAAVLLFGGWTKGWYVWGYRPPPVTMTDMHRVMRRMWPQGAIAEQVYRQSPFLGMIAKRSNFEIGTVLNFNPLDGKRSSPKRP